MDEEQSYLASLQQQPVTRRIRGYFRLTGPGYMQSAMTLGSGSIASCVLMGSLLGYELMWVPVLAIILGYALLASIAKQACHTNQKPYHVFWERLHPALAVLWGVSAFIATIIWHIPQYSLAANGVLELASGVNLDLSGTASRLLVGVVILGCATCVVYMYNTGIRGLKIYEKTVKILVWSIVVAFAWVAFSTGIDWSRLFFGVTGITFIREALWGHGIPQEIIIPVIGGIAAAVGINMVFLYPYSLLNKKWTKEYTELAYFDLLSGMVLPFVIATGFMMIAVANTIGPESGAVGTAVRDIREILPVLNDTLGATLALLLIGFGMLAIGFSTIITHMLACGFIGCELFNIDHQSKAKFYFSLTPAIGVVGVLISMPWWASVTASSLAAPLMPVAVVCFLVLLNMPSYMGKAMPRGGKRVLWNSLLITSILVLGVSSYFSIQQNYSTAKARLNEFLANPQTEVFVQDENLALESESTEDIGTQQSFRRYEARHGAMGTVFEIVVYEQFEVLDGAAFSALAQDIFNEIDMLERRISNWRDDSDVSALNRAAGVSSVSVHWDVLELLRLSGDIYNKTEGAFDVTVGPLLDLWGFYRREGHLPDSEALEKALNQVGFSDVTWDAAEGTARLEKPGMKIDFGGIGKGMAVDRAVNMLRAHGVSRASVSSGTSSVRFMEPPPGRNGWTVNIRHPYNDIEEPIDTIELSNVSISTSAGYENWVELDGKKYSHIFDPRTGVPVDGVLSTSAITETGVESDALSTAFYVMGLEKTKEFCTTHTNMRAIIVIEQNGEATPVRINLP